MSGGFTLRCPNKMEFSDLLTKFTKKEEPLKEYFWALELWEGGVKSAIWSVENGKTKVVSLGSQESWKESAGDLAEAVDRSFTTASERFIDPGQEPSKVIFGLPHDWLEEEKIVSGRRGLLQKICEKLELSPLGFVLTIDSLNHHLKDVEGVPPSAIVVNPHQESVVVAVLEIGKVNGLQSVRRSEDLGADVYEGLSRFEGLKNLPSRILLFNGEDMEGLRQNLIEFAWTQKLPFLHFPKIEILPHDFDITSVCLAGGSEVAKSLGFKILEAGESLVEEQPTAPETTEPELSEPEPDFGFVKGKDIRLEEEVGSRVEEEQVETEKTEDEKVVGEETELAGAFQAMREYRNEPENIQTPKSKLPKIALPFSLPSFSFHLPRISPPGGGLVLVGIIGGLILLLGVGAFTLLMFKSKAEVTIFVSAKTLDKQFTLTVDPNQEVIDSQNLVLPGKVLNAEASGDKNKNTTGNKTVGDKAKGEVTILNIGATRNLNAGVTLTGPGGLKFSLDQAVSIASGSALGGPGQAKAAVTAADIGADYNLAASSEFSVGTFDKSVVAAKNDAALSGGTSRQIQAVSDADQKDLVGQLTDDLKQKAKTDLLAGVPSDRKLIEDSMTVKESSRTFNHKVGDEASSLSLNLKIKASALSFAQNDFLSLVQKQIEASIPTDYQLQSDGVKSQFEVQESKPAGSATFNVSVTASLLPKLDIAAITQSIKGKSPTAAKQYFAGLPGYADAEIVIKPSLPKFLTLPRTEKNITIEIRPR